MPDRDTFFQQYAGLAQQAAQQLGIPASVVLGILGSESSFGNLHGSDGSVSLTGETYVGQPGAHPETFISSNGQPVTLAMFPTPEAAMGAFVHNLSTPLYANAIAQGGSPNFIQALADAGYVQADQKAQWVGLITSLAQQAQASIGGAPAPQLSPRPGSQPVSASIGGNVNDSVMGPNGRTFGQIRGTQYLSPDEATFYRNLAGIANPAPAPQQQAPQPLGPTVAPGQEYAPGALGDQQRFNYLTGLVQRGVTIGPDAQQFLNNYGNDQGQDFGGGRAGARIGITPPSTGDGGLQGQQQPAVPFYGTAQPSAGNQTTLDNATAQAQYDQNTANAQQAANQAYQASPAVAGALAAQQPAPAISGTPSQGDQANAQQGGAESQFQGFKHGGEALVGERKKRKPSAPSLPVGAPFADWGVNNGDFNTTPVVPPVGMPINGVNPNFNDAMPVGRNLSSLDQPQMYADGGGMDVGSGSVRAPEPIMAIGVNTGKPYFEAGEAGLERISVTPIKKMEDGGTATAGLDPNDPRNQGFGSQPGSTSFQAPPPPIMGPAASNYTPPDYSQYGDPRAQQLADQQALLNSRLASIGPSQSYIDAQGRVIQSRSDNIPNQSAYLGAQGNVYNQQAANFPNQSNYLGALGGVYNAQQGTIGPQQNYIGAQGNVIGAQEQQTAGQRGFIGQEQQANAQTLQEEQAQIAAAHNIPDLTATGAAQNYQDSTDYLYRMGGVAPPADVDTRGAPLPAGSPVNTRAKIQSQAEILKANNAEAQNVRNLQLQGAKLAVDLLGTNVDAAREAAARVGLTVDQAKLVVQQAQNQADIAQLAVRYGDLNTAKAQNQAEVAGLNVRYGDLNTSQFQNAADLAGLGVRQADLNTERLGYQNSLSELPPQAGLAVYTNPFTGESKYMTPAQARVQEQADSALIGGGGSALGTYGTGASNAGVAAAAGVPRDESGDTEAGGYAKQSESSLLAAYKAGRLGRYLTLSALITKYKAMGLDDKAAAARAQFNVNQIDAAKTGAASGSSSGGGGFVPQFSN